MPLPMVVEMKIESITPSFCGTKIVAKRGIIATTSTMVETIEITDYTGALCEKYIPYLVEAEYTYQNSSILPNTQPEFKKLVLGFN